MNQLEEARMEIDGIDTQLAQLFAQRMKAVESVAAFKKENNLPVFDEAREAQVLEKHAARMSEEGMQDEFAEWMKHLMDLSKTRQRELLCENTVAYCGVEGAFAHQVTMKLFPRSNMLSFSSFDDVFDAVVHHKARFGILPFENTSSGLVGEVLDGLMKHNVFIHQVYDARIHQCLLAVPGAKLADLQWVYSKDQALWQAETFLKALEVQTIPYPNTAMAAQYVAMEADPSKAAVGSKENARLYGLDILAENIEGDMANTTRFLVISAKEQPREEEYAAFLMSVNNEVGALAKAINIISAFGLNMNSLQSRPRKGHPFEYYFFVQTEGRIGHHKRSTCISALEQICASIKWLGSYSIRKEEEQ